MRPLVVGGGDGEISAALRAHHRPRPSHLPGGTSFDVTFEAGLDLPGLAADGFGLSQLSVTTQTAQQDNPNDSATASVREPFTIAHAGHATISASLPGEDIDLFVVRDANGDGSFTTDEIVASSATASGSESVTMVRPPDGNYQVWVHGFSVSTPATVPYDDRCRAGQRPHHHRRPERPGGRQHPGDIVEVTSTRR